MKRVLFWLISIAGFILLVSCTSPEQAQPHNFSSPITTSFPSQRPSGSPLSETPYIESIPSPTPLAKSEKLTAWVTYWDMQNVMEEACGLGDSLGSLSFFAAYFNAHEELFVREEVSLLLEECKKSLSDTLPTRYITIVNDKLNQNSPASLKDVDLLHSLFESDDTINAHIDDLIALAIDGGYDGLEIDYERIRNDLNLWERFLTFLNRLHKRTDEAGLYLRVLLEPSTPFERIEFPAGPEYVMMCYNLYGSHTKPGPKADAAFIRRLAEKMSGLPGDKAIAIATGGFDWQNSGSVASVTEAQATALRDEYSAQLCRDEASMCAVFKYRDEEKSLHEVWYADGVTLRYWMDIIKEYDNFSVAIWRLGGNNSMDTLFGE